MFRQLLPTVLLLLLSVQLPGITGARAIEADPAAFLPPNATVRQTVQGDVDGDGRSDLVALYALPGFDAAAPLRAGVLVLLATDAGAQPVHLFGPPPHDLRGEPVLDRNGSSELTLQDLVGDGRPRIVLSVTNRFPNSAPRTLLWAFGWGSPGQPSASTDDDEIGPPLPPWTGTGFRLEAYLEGNHVIVETPADGGPSVLRRQLEERTIGGPDPVLALTETLRWRRDGFRLAERSLTLPAATAGAARSPETAVLSFYAALGRGDLIAATDLLSDDLRASRSATLTGDPTAPSQNIRVEEVRLLDDHLTRRDRMDPDRLVYVRVSMADPRTDPSAADTQARRYTIAGTWQTRKAGEQWQLVAASHRETADLAAIADQLPASTAIIQTASGDLRGSGMDDIAVLAAGPGRFTLVEPYILFAGPGGLQPAVPLASYVTGGMIGGPFGTIRMDDVNGDGALEVTFSGVVGAHSALLWVLHWDGVTLAPLFDGVSNSPVIGLEDLDSDGVAEILMVQSGYCGSYASSPVLAFAFRWENGAYRSASWRYPTLQDGIDDRAQAVSEERSADPSQSAARACVQHMLAMANIFRGRAADARLAYRAYLDLRQQSSADSRVFLRPIYLGEQYVEADLRASLTAAEGGQLGAWTPADRAIIHALLGDALLSRAQHHRSEAEYAAREGKPEREQAARRKESDARQAAAREYQAARDLAPADAWPAFGD